MKRIILLAGILFALTLIFRDQSRFEKGEVSELSQPTVLEKLQAVPSLREEPLATEVLEETKARVEEEAEFVPAFFPDSKVVASVRDESNDGNQRVIENVETTMRDKLVRVERVMEPMSDGSSRVVQEVAMVANQLMLQKPAGMASYMFLDLLSQAGAVEVKELDGDAYLATFNAQPANPRALDTHMAKVQELAGVELTVEPNYIRKIF